MADGELSEGRRSRRLRLSRSSWAQEVTARSMKLRDRIPHVDDAVRSEIADKLDKADELCSTRARLFTWRRFVDWWFGNRVEDAWSLLHHVELMVIDHSAPELLPLIMEEAVLHAAVLDQADPARVRLSDYLKTQTLPIGSQH